VDQGQVALSLKDVSKSFGKVYAVKGASLEVRPGEMVGFLGPNGAGKSTTLYMMTRLVLPTSGIIRIFGHDVWRQGRQAMLNAGAMVEAPCFYEYLTARKNLLLRSRLYPNSNKKDIESILGQIGLQDRANEKVAVYSQGMKQRLGVGMALLGNPRLVLLDEPTNGMDPVGTQQMLGFLKAKCRDEGIAVFLSSHLLSEVEEYCDKVVVINKGIVVDSGRVEDILKPRQNVIKVDFVDKVPQRSALSEKDGIVSVEPGPSDRSLIITLGNKDPAWLNTLLVANKFKVSSLAPRQKTLRQFFVDITGGFENAH